ncbi:hypothetical protein EVAR_59380_1 [Eumeta japonica]|uniref:Uncharacterized protein n=1 Tax=Eumeta variegata TaxID=151549 RepID=A0A4C1YMA8_EUMVA|nr:hypothetical protein EVAR_59380_1 [Eumeta japonica]
MLKGLPRNKSLHSEQDVRTDQTRVYFRSELYLLDVNIRRNIARYKRPNRNITGGAKDAAAGASLRFGTGGGAHASV